MDPPTLVTAHVVATAAVWMARHTSLDECWVTTSSRPSACCPIAAGLENCWPDGAVHYSELVLSGSWVPTCSRRWLSTKE
jgi:hypothetical protein